jgi:prepilin-type N-terminal cleavage/methylation domain-containing protein
MKRPRAFTLIELLIVVAIIAILAAIAVPNFLEAQVRAKVSRVKSDSRALIVAAEAYRVDNNDYPWPNDEFLARRDITWDARQARLTSPIAYITSLLRDPFRSILEGHNPNHILDFEVQGVPGGVDDYWFSQDATMPLVDWPMKVWIRSWGPDQVMELPPWSMATTPYDSTNGTNSRGDLFAILPGPVYYP